MTKSICDYVNVFQGTGKSVLPKKDQLFSRWNLLKGKAGNTSPSACLPFGAVACSPYSGGYSSGYGNMKVNTGRPVESYFEGNKLYGFTHFTHSGCGQLGFYYNYLLTVPFKKDLSTIHTLKDITAEFARPGYYSCIFKNDNIRAEVTVSEKSAVHRYTSLDGKPLKIAIDISNDGLIQTPLNDVLFSYCEESNFRSYENGDVGGYVVMQGVKLWFYIICRASKVSLWLDKKPMKNDEVYTKKTDKTFGAFWETDESTAIVKIAFSLIDEQHAKDTVMRIPEFDEAKCLAEEKWEKRLSTIELEEATERDKEIFYSNYYHSLVKPCAWEKESFLWREDNVFYVDFTTLWDVYKTQMPLLFTLHKDIGAGIVKTLLRYGKEQKGLFNALLLSSNMNLESQQACCLGCYVLYDAYVRGLIEEQDIDDLFAVVKTEIRRYDKSVIDGTIEKTTKLLDVTLIAKAFADIAKKLNRTEDYNYLSTLGDYWIKAYADDGLLKKEYPYYEGNYWNYSFRFVDDVETRLSLAGGKEKVNAQLDAFFAFNDANEIINRFEGFNNETDMETPYFYHYVDRYDRIERIMTECMENCFQSGKDGLPGNNDSGGLSACYMWNFLGLFPISGQEKMFIGCPKAKKTVLHLANGNDLTLRSVGEGKTIQKVIFNGQEITSTISVDAIMSGGEIVFFR